jgi:hypothetical protein
MLMSRFSKIGVRTTFLVLLIGFSLGFARTAIATLYTCNQTCSDAANNGGIYLGRTYDIIFTNQAFNNTTAPAYNLQTTAWWGDSALARGLATVVGNPGGGIDPDFAYQLRSDQNEVNYYHFTDNEAKGDHESITRVTYFAFGTEVTHHPEINGAMFPKAALLLFSLYLLRFSRRAPLSSDSRVG